MTDGRVLDTRVAWLRLSPWPCVKYNCTRATWLRVSDPTSSLFDPRPMLAAAWLLVSDAPVAIMPLILQTVNLGVM